MTPHLTRDELVDWRDRGDAADRDRVVSHLAECDACGALLRELVRVRGADGGLAAAPDEIVAAGLAAGERTRATFAARWRRLAAAAAIVGAVGSVVVLQRARETGRLAAPATDEVRSAGIQPLSPAGPAAPPFTFRWASPLAATAYRLEVSGPDGSVYSATTAVNAVELPQDVAEHLVSGVAYSWTVTALDSGGRPVSTSPAQRFIVR